MADLEKTMEAMQEWIDAAFPDEYPLGIMQDALELLKEQPKIVRCKDCKHYLIPENEKIGECMMQPRWFPISDTNWFCADGERNDALTQ